MCKKRTAHNKLTQEQAIQQVVGVHGDTYGYDKVVYVDSITPVDIFCKVHQEYFPQILKNHKKGAGCPKCGRERQIESAKDGKEEFVKRGISLYGELDDYSKVEYINTKTEVTLTCKQHGEYKKRPDIYLQGSRCPSCRERTTRKGHSKYSNKELFEEAGKLIHGDVTDYSKVGDICKNTKVELRCKNHDHEYTIGVSAHLGGQKCPKCAMENYSLLRKKTTEQFIEEAKEVYGDLDDYTNTVYEGCRSQIKIRCKEHDYEFKTLSNNYLNGFGCPKCRAENSNYSGHKHHHTREGYVYLSKGRNTHLYLIKCTNENEIFYKIGKTFRGMDERFTKSNMPYNYEILYTKTGSAENIWDLEEKLHKKYKKYKYNTDIIFPGYSECYNLDLPIDKIVNI